MHSCDKRVVVGVLVTLQVTGGQQIDGGVIHIGEEEIPARDQNSALKGTAVFFH